ncbi:dihydroorotase [bacterium]|nr:dihydroorotase [candidate division CSSED10-310 bacterium]
MEELYILNGRIVDPAQNMDETADIRIKNGLIQSIGPKSSPSKKARIINAEGKWVVPGLCDMHVHLREPGREDKETIYTGSRAAAAGGFTSIACMANTQPVNDCQAVTRFIIERAGTAPVKVLPIAAITKQLYGKELTEMGDLVQAGAAAFSDDGVMVRNAELLRRALEYAKMFGKTIIEHCEDLDLSADGVMHEGLVSTRLGLPGIPPMAEDVAVQRDIEIAEFVDGKLHIAHVSTARTVELIRQAKEKGVAVTAEVTPHHLFLTDEVVASFDTNTKMKPPLRSETDRAALIQGLVDGTIDCIASDHAPHTLQEKDVEFSLAPNGIIGLETSLSLVLTKLVHTRRLSLMRMVESMSTAPCRILGIDPPAIKTGKIADITIIDPEEYWPVDPNRFFSKSRNTPFTGWNLRGAAFLTISEGRIAYDAATDRQIT